MRRVQSMNKTIPTLREVECPACSKKRLLKVVGKDGTVEPTSTETIAVRDEERFVETCRFCQMKYEKSDKKFVMSNLKKLQKAVRNPDRDSKSDHKDFSLDI